jgi:hypothetical protein
MITFKQFLYERELEHTLQVSELDMDDAISALNEHASDASWMLVDDLPLYRGELSGAISSKLKNTGFAFVDPSKTSRSKSISTSDYYRTILDNTPSRKDFPKRANSMIASTDKTIAKGYSPQGLPPLRVIPFNGVKIGVVNKPDMWNTKIQNFFNIESASIEDVNRIWKKIKDIDESDWSSFVQFDKRLKQKDPDAIKQLRDALFIGWDFGRVKSSNKIQTEFPNFLEEIDKAYSPESTGHTWYTTKNMPRDLDNTEVWIGGPVICISEEAWEKLRQMV